MVLPGSSNQRRRFWPALAAVSFLASAMPAFAAQDVEPPAAVPEAEILLDAGSEHGRIAVNVAAGDNNQQANVGVIAIGGTSIASGFVAQHLASSGPQASSSTSALIAENAFAGSSGLIAVNIAGGSENQQVNLALVSIGIEGVAATDAMLSQTRASQQPVQSTSDTAETERVTGIGAGAFAGATGLVQVNLIGGERNSSANTFALTVTAGVN